MLVIRPVVPAMDGQPVAQRLLAARVVETQAATIEWIMRDDGGRPVRILEVPPESGSSSSISADSSSSSSSESAGTVPPRISVRMTEAISRSAIWSVTGDVHNAEAGIIRFTLPESAVADNCILRVEVGIYHGTRLVFSNQFYIVVDSGLFGANTAAVGCPTIDQIRSAVRDAGPNDNYLLARLEWALGDIAESLVVGIATWNQTFPNVAGKYNTANFFDPVSLIGASLAYLYRQAGLNYLRNDLGYAAAGVSVDDKRKAQAYLELAASYEAGFKAWITNQKRAISRGNFAGSVQSDYMLTSWWARIGE